MRSGNAKRDHELLAHARRLGLTSSSSDTCVTSGMRGPRVDPPDPHGAALDGPCADRSGSGRWWFSATRTLGTSGAHRNDAPLRIQIAAGDRGAARGHQG